MPDTPIRCFVGAPADGLDAELQMVFLHSLRSRASVPVSVIWMQPSDNPASMWAGWDRRSWATPFTGYRFAVAAACGYEGKAIYCDCDQILLGDINELYNMELASNQVMAARGGWRFDVMLIDCERIKPYLLPLAGLKKANGFQLQSDVFRKRPELIRPFGLEWDYLDNEDRGPLSETKLVHLTHLPTQPNRRLALARLQKEGRQHWYRGASRPHPRPEIQRLFDEEYSAAWDAGLRPEDFYRDVC